eukprot:TRINITY_DN3575_c0_g1_i1.p1 TRINITY_DN3575_c0_g1~~TRINITY_DN3575_c0_g1_i1.p1  ORF type:complete len:851 (-),score=176.14 TRINITY_DN3575_c0_g1_i1:66-2618(-)
MKFGKQLKQAIVPEWASQYVSYRSLKKIVQRARRAGIRARQETSAVEQEFIAAFISEVKKAESFYVQQVAKVRDRFEQLKLQVIAMSSLMKSPAEAQHAQSLLSNAFVQLHRAFELLKSFGIYNHLACAKILKKHDKVIRHRLTTRLLPVIDRLQFNTRVHLDDMTHTTETVYAEMFANGDRRAAMQRLRVTERRVTRGEMFRFGCFLGLALPALWNIIRMAIAHPNWDGLPDSQLVLSAYRGMGLIVLMFVYFALNEWGWSAMHINYVFIFEMDPGADRSPLQLLEGAAMLMLVWATSLFAMLAIVHEGAWVVGIPAWAWPLIMVLVALAYLINPLNVFQREARFWLVTRLLRIVSAPLTAVGFADFFVADQLNSLVLLLYDLEYVICYYSADVWYGSSRCLAANVYTRPILGAMPALWRFLQCLRRYRDTGDKFPHLANAGKYSMTFLVVAFSNLSKNFPDQVIWRVIWALVAFAGTSYAYLWDVTMDWSIVKLRGGVQFMRPLLMYQYRGLYWFAIISDLLLRLAWLLTLSPIPGMVQPETLLLVFGVLELTRRFMWNFFRMENEHVNNIGAFRAVREVPLPFTIEQKKQQRAREDARKSRKASTVAKPNAGNPSIVPIVPIERLQAAGVLGDADDDDDNAGGYAETDPSFVSTLATPATIQSTPGQPSPTMLPSPAMDRQSDLHNQESFRELDQAIASIALGVPEAMQIIHESRLSDLSMARLHNDQLHFEQKSDTASEGSQKGSPKSSRSSPRISPRVSMMLTRASMSRRSTIAQEKATEADAQSAAAHAEFDRMLHNLRVMSAPPVPMEVDSEDVTAMPTRANSIELVDMAAAKGVKGESYLPL